MNQTETTSAPLTTEQTEPVVFTFGDAESVLDKRDIVDYLECVNMGDKWYVPPVSMDGLAKSSRAAVHHNSAMLLKRNILVSCFQPTGKLSVTDFAAWAHEYLIFGNAYLERKRSRTGKVLEYRPGKARYIRRGIDLDQYWFIPRYNEEIALAKGDVFHLLEPDINQEIYGLPEYIPALHSAWLNESATLFRRRYYANGSHAGFILYMTDPAQNQGDIDNLRASLKAAKGPGNFRNLFMYAPGGKKDGIQLIPVAEVAAKDEFANIKNITRDDMLAAHRVPPQVMGIVPNNTGGFNDVEKASAVFYQNEIKPLIARMLEVNDWAREEVVRFKPYDLGIQVSEPTKIPKI